MKTQKYELAAALERTHKALSDLLGFVNDREVHGSVSDPARYYHCYGNALSVLISNRRDVDGLDLPLSGNLVRFEGASEELS